MNSKHRNIIASLTSSVVIAYWLMGELTNVANMSIAAISKTLVQSMGISIATTLVVIIIISIFFKSKEKWINDERDELIELYVMRIILVFFSIGLILILTLLGWFDLTINHGIVAIYLSMYVANIAGEFVKIYWYK